MSEYRIKLANQTGGKAGRGRNKTSTVQVFCGSCIVKQFRFSMIDHESYKAAMMKAKHYIGKKHEHNTAAETDS